MEGNNKTCLRFVFLDIQAQFYGKRKVTKNETDQQRTTRHSRFPRTEGLRIAKKIITL